MEFEKLQSLVRSGQINSISLDTSIFDASGLRLSAGLLKSLNQFKDTSTVIVISEIVKEELIKHLTKKIEEVQQQVDKTLQNAKDYLCIDEDEINQCRARISTHEEPQLFAVKQFKQFVEDTGLTVISSNNVVVEELIQKYFKSQPPFAESGKKKSEFPDAIALMSLEAWAIEHQTQIILVTRDKDWKSFCEQSERLIFCDDLAKVISLFQLEDARSICEYLSELYRGGEFIEIKDYIYDALIPYAEDFEVNSNKLLGGCRYEQEMVDVLDVDIDLRLLEQPNVVFRPVNFDEEGLVAVCETDFEVTAEFQLSSFARDSVDREDILVDISSSTLRVLIHAEVLVLFTADTYAIGSDFSVDEVHIDSLEISSETIT